MIGQEKEKEKVVGWREIWRENEKQRERERGRER